LRHSHFETLKPVCPRCRADRELISPLKLVTIDTKENDNIIQGVLHCSDVECQLEYPIIDGIPIILHNIRSYLSDNIFHITNRDDLSNTIESILGDGVGPNTLFDVTRQHLSTYGWTHFQDLISAPPRDDLNSANNTLVNCAQTGFELIAQNNFSPILDIGCSVGRTSFELADNYQGLVLGVDVNFSMLRIAQSILHKGFLRFPLRRYGIVYDEIEQSNLSFSNSNNVDFWCCNALSLPFSDDSFELTTSLNVLDAVNSPYDLLQSIYRVLKPSGNALFSTPFDWSTSATPIEAWIGGHSQRSESNGSPEIMLKTLLQNMTNSTNGYGLSLCNEIKTYPWTLRIHDRHEANYKTYIFNLIAKKENLQ